MTNKLVFQWSKLQYYDTQCEYTSNIAVQSYKMIIIYKFVELLYSNSISNLTSAKEDKKSIVILDNQNKFKEKYPRVYVDELIHKTALFE